MAHSWCGVSPGHGHTWWVFTQSLFVSQAFPCLSYHASIHDPGYQRELKLLGVRKSEAEALRVGAWWSLPSWAAVSLRGAGCTLPKHACPSSLQIPRTCLATVGPKRLEALRARRLVSISRLAPSARAEAAWHPKASGFLLRTKQVISPVCLPGWVGMCSLECEHLRGNGC